MHAYSWQVHATTKEKRDGYLQAYEITTLGYPMLLLSIISHLFLIMFSRFLNHRLPSSLPFSTHPSLDYHHLISTWSSYEAKYKLRKDTYRYSQPHFSFLFLFISIPRPSAFVFGSSLLLHFISVNYLPSHSCACFVFLHFFILYIWSTWIVKFRAALPLPSPSLIVHMH